LKVKFRRVDQVINRVMHKSGVKINLNDFSRKRVVVQQLLLLAAVAYPAAPSGH